MELSRVFFKPILDFKFCWQLGSCLLTQGNVLAHAVSACCVPLSQGPGGVLSALKAQAKALPPCRLPSSALPPGGVAHPEGG